MKLSRGDSQRSCDVRSWKIDGPVEQAIPYRGSRVGGTSVSHELCDVWLGQGAMGNEVGGAALLIHVTFDLLLTN